MIEECNFKQKIKEDSYYLPPGGNTKVKIQDKGDYCRLTGIKNSICVGEENCVSFQTYKLLNLFLIDYTDIRKEIADKLQKFKEKK